MTYEVYAWKDGSFSVTRDGRSYNFYREVKGDGGKKLVIDEPAGNDES